MTGATDGIGKAYAEEVRFPALDFQTPKHQGATVKQEGPRLSVKYMEYEIIHKGVLEHLGLI